MSTLYRFVTGRIQARMSNNYLFNEVYTETRLCDELEENSIHELLYIVLPHIVYPGIKRLCVLAILHQIVIFSRII